MVRWAGGLLIIVGLYAARPVAAAAADGKLDFNRDIRPILSNNCFQCHGPDGSKRKGGADGLRLDLPADALADLGGYAAIVPGKPADSELVKRVRSTDPDEHMPPAATGKKLSPHEIEVLEQWISQGAPFARHWSYVKPVRSPLPEVRDKAWPRNPIDLFILARLEREGLKASPEADREALVRRLALDLTGLPPTVAEVDDFLADSTPDAYEKLVDRLLAKESYGEHWARLWLDLARYADSSGYADDPARTIWAYRDYVIRALNANKPFDQFTIEQIAGDLLPQPTEDQLIATAFHRNTQTNNEGGTNDEEYRNVAVVDRVNTTLAVWMGTTIACAQCHTHKFDPISQEEFFRVFAILNNTEDADRADESPTIMLYTEEQKRQKAEWEGEIAALELKLQTTTPELLAAAEQWQQSLATEPAWNLAKHVSMKSAGGAAMTLQDDHSILVAPGQKTDTYTIELAPAAGKLTGLQLEALPHDSLPAKGPGYGAGNFVVSRVSVALTPPAGNRLTGRFVRIEIPGPQKILSLAEVQVFSGADNIAVRGEATQHSVAYDGLPKLAIDGNTDGRYNEAKSTTHTAIADGPWWEVDLGSAQPVDRIVIWNRTDAGVSTRLANFRVAVLDELREPVWKQHVAPTPDPSAEFSLSGARAVTFAAAYADYSQPSFAPAQVLDNKDITSQGWAVGTQFGQRHTLTLVPTSAIEIADGAKLNITIEQLSKYEQHVLGRLRIGVSQDSRAIDYARLPPQILATLKVAAADRTEAQRNELVAYYLKEVAPELKVARQRLVEVKQQLAGSKPTTTVPIQRELAANQRRMTKLQHRGNFLDVGQEVGPGVPAAFHPLPAGAAADRLALARWLVDADNPLTARVTVNRYWERMFGIGIVATSEEFGSQGELPSHPELLDWLATELVQHGWDTKYLLKLLVTSAAYRQSSKVMPGVIESDPENRLLARGPRFRLSAEMIRDQALAVSGLLSPKMYGAPVKPPQPSSGLSAAFGSGIDWQTSMGEDKFRRGLYTTWRRSNPYPSMASFDAPNQEVCTLRRSRTNTPLQALVTLNDPVFVEAAQALARRIAVAGDTPTSRAKFGFRLCVSRQPTEAELARLVALYQSAYDRYSNSLEDAVKLATDPLGLAPDGSNVVELAAWTVVSNVLLNLDEMFMKR